MQKQKDGRSRGARFALVLCAAGLGIHAAAQCPKSGNELVFFGAGGRGQGNFGAKAPGSGVSAGGAGVPNGGGGPVAADSGKGQPGAETLPPEGIYTACLNVASGHLTSLGLQARVKRASWVLVDPTRPALYTTGSVSGNMRDGGSVFSFSIDRDSGALRPLGTSPSGGSDPTHLAWDAHSRTLFVANHGEGIVGAIRTDADGGTRALSDKAQEEGSGPTARQKNAAAHGLAVDPTGHFVLSADFGADRLYVYRYDEATGKLSPSSPAYVATPAGSGPRHITFTRSGRYVVMDTEMDGQLRVYRWNEKDGTLQQGQVVNPYPADYKEAKSAAEIEMSPNGKFFYLSLRGKEDKLLAYKWDEASGSLTEIQRIPSSGGTPWSFGIDPSGKWMLVTNSATGNVSVFALDRATGKLELNGEPMKLPGAMTVDFLSR